MDPRGDGRRRFLIAAGVTTGLVDTADKIAASVAAMTDLLVGTFGYERAASVGLNPKAERVREAVREFCLARDPQDVVVLYYTGHADLGGDRHRLWMGDTRDRYTKTVPTG
jgi:Caspase domain